MLVPFFSYLGLIFSVVVTVCFTRKQRDALGKRDRGPGGPVVADLNGNPGTVDSHGRCGQPILLDTCTSYDTRSLVEMVEGDCSRKESEDGTAARQSRSNTSSSVDIDKDEPQSSKDSDIVLQITTIQEEDEQQKLFR
jgi:hypothetical protein